VEKIGGFEATNTSHIANASCEIEEKVYQKREGKMGVYSIEEMLNLVSCQKKRKIEGLKPLRPVGIDGFYNIKI
jgi:hypothetical protein